MKKSLVPEFYMHTREPERAWLDRLAEISPRTDALSWLKLVWEPGDLWEPVQRWVLWQMRPLGTVPGYIDESELHGPHPRSSGHFCSERTCQCKVPTDSWRGGPCHTIDRLTWELFQETGCYGERWWIVQGTQGGNRYRWNSVERQLSQLHGGPRVPPTPGSLAYAEPDWRTWEQVADQNLIRSYTHMTDFLLRTPSMFDAEARRGAEQCAEELWKWLEKQIGAAVNDTAPVIRDVLREAGSARPDIKSDLRLNPDAHDYDLARHRFITEHVGTAD